MMCPAAYELALWNEGRLPGDARTRIDQHLETCSHCRSVVQRIVKWDVKPAARPVSAVVRNLRGFEPLPADPDTILPGQIWLAAEAPGVVLITHSLETEGLYAAHPVSTETAYLSNRDVWLSAGENPLNVPVMIQAWLHVKVDRESLQKYVGQVRIEIQECIQRVHLEETTVADQQRLGPVISGTQDPRYAFQSRLMVLWNAVSQRARARAEQAIAQNVEKEVQLVATREESQLVYRLIPDSASESKGGILKAEQVPQALRGLPMVCWVNVQGAVPAFQTFGETIVVTSGVDDARRYGIRVADSAGDLRTLEPLIAAAM